MSNSPIITISILEEAAYVGLSLIYGCHGFKLGDQLKRPEANAPTTNSFSPFIAPQHLTIRIDRNGWKHEAIDFYPAFIG